VDIGRYTVLVSTVGARRTKLIDLLVLSGRNFEDWFEAYSGQKRRTRPTLTSLFPASVRKWMGLPGGLPTKACRSGTAYAMPSNKRNTSKKMTLNFPLLLLLRGAHQAHPASPSANGSRGYVDSKAPLTLKRKKKSSKTPSRNNINPRS